MPPARPCGSRSKRPCAPAIAAAHGGPGWVIMKRLGKGPLRIAGCKHDP